MKVPSVKTVSAEPGVPAPWSASVLLARLPVLGEFLCNPLWDGGEAKGERSVMTFIKAQSVTAILKVEHPALKLVVAGSGYDEAIAALETALKLPEAPWQADDNPLGRSGKKRK